MKKVIAVAAVLSCLGLSGCASWFNGKADIPFLETPYQAGRTFVFVDTVTEPFQPAEVGAAIDQVYVVAELNIQAIDFLDEFVSAEINGLYSDSTPETREMIFAIYKAMFARIEFQMDNNPEIPKVEVLDDFFRGVRDALKIYQPKENENGTAEPTTTE